MQFNNPPRKIKNNMATPHLKKSMSGSPLRLGFFLAALALVCFGLSPAAQAVSPPPDGGYPNFNTAEGDGALFTLTTGSANTALGFEALFSNTAGGANTATGFRALRFNTSGGHSNTANGAQALYHNTTGDDNGAIGSGALSDSTTGSFNTAIGSEALGFNETGNNNTAIGQSAALATTTGGGNTAIGFQDLQQNTTGERNTAIGYSSLDKNTTGSFNVALGAGAGRGVITANDVICIGRAVDGVNVSGTCFIGNIRGVTTQNANALPVVIDGAGQLGTVASSERFKKDIAIMGQASEGILALRPVTFHYKTDGTSTPQFGLIAEEVAKVNPALVLPDKEGKPYTVRYDAVNAMLLNEFLKARRQIDSQQKQIDALTAGLQKVSAQLELNKPAPQVTENDR